MISSDLELKTTLAKFAELEAHIAPQVEQERQAALSPVQRLSLRSMRRLANSLREEIARYLAPQREDLLRSLGLLCEARPELRFGQLIANLAVVARGAEPSAVWDMEDEELLAAARRQLER